MAVSTLPTSRQSNPFSGVLTLAAQNTNYNLYSLIAAIDPNAAINVAQLLLIADDGNSNNIALIQGRAMSAMTDGDQMIPTSSRNFGNGFSNGVSLATFKVRSDANNQKLRVHCIVT